MITVARIRFGREWAIIIVYAGVSACIFYYVSIATATPLCTPFYYNPLPIITLTPNLSSVRLLLQLPVALPYLLLVPWELIRRPVLQHHCLAYVLEPVANHIGVPHALLDRYLWWVRLLPLPLRTVLAIDR